jgi:hypothetical protein
MSTKLDANQVLKRSFDDVNDRLRVDAEVTATLGTVEVVISHVNDSIKIGDGTDLLAINADGTIDIKNITGVISLPTGAATSAKQDTGNTSIANVDSKLTASTSTMTGINRSNVSQTVLAANSNRKGFMFHNDTGAVCYIAFAATASTAAFTIRLTTNSFYESAQPCYTGIISVIWGTNGTNQLLVTELT